MDRTDTPVPRDKQKHGRPQDEKRQTGKGSVRQGSREGAVRHKGQGRGADLSAWPGLREGARGTRPEGQAGAASQRATQAAIRAEGVCPQCVGASVLRAPFPVLGPRRLPGACVRGRGAPYAAARGGEKRREAAGCFAWATTQRTTGHGGKTTETLFPHSSGGWTSKTVVSAGLASAEASLLGSDRAASLEAGVTIQPRWVQERIGREEESEVARVNNSSGKFCHQGEKKIAQ